MLFELTKSLQTDVIFRSAMSSVTGFVLSLLLGPFVIKKLHNFKIRQSIRLDGPATHLVKLGVPTMGGLLILFTVILSVLLWADLKNPFIWVTLFVTLGFAVIGWMDDYRKVIHGNSIGMKAHEKFFWQSLIGLIASFWILFLLDSSSILQSEKIFFSWLSHGNFLYATNRIFLIFPFLKPIPYPFGWMGFILFTFIVMIGTSNAVNLTDGLDGLVALPVAGIGLSLGIFAYIVGNVLCSSYFLLPYVSGARELTVFCSAIAGSCLAFLWYNTYPAQVFMGDVGSLALGGALGTVAVITRQEIVLFIMGGIFVAETCSVILQVLFFKWSKYRFGRGHRLLKMAPLHHHFELSGWKETQVVVRFWIITVFLILIGLSTLNYVGC